MRWRPSLSLGAPWAILSALILAPVLPAQGERPPERYQIAIGLMQRGLHDEAAGYLEEFLGRNSRKTGYSSAAGWNLFTRQLGSIRSSF